MKLYEPIELLALSLSTGHLRVVQLFELSFCCCCSCI